MEKSSNSRFSDCLIWKLQQKFFCHQGITAWKETVPFYITSNPFLAHSYATILIRFMIDCMKNKEYNPEEPFYILELGAGSGKFGFYLIKALSEMRKTLNLTCHFIYIMSDLAEKNITFYQSHPALKKYIKEGYLDFAILDAASRFQENTNESNLKIQLVNKKITLEKNSISSPLMVIANYFFDSIPNDLFRVKHGALQEGLVSLDPYSLDNRTEIENDLHETKIDFSYHNTTSSYYEEEHFNTILKYYMKNLTQSVFLFPIAGLSCINHLSTLSSSKKLFLLLSDKGECKLSELNQTSSPYIEYHGSISLNVNFHAIERFFTLLNGEAYHPSLRPGMKTSAFLMNDKIAHFPETQQALTDKLENNAMTDFYNIHAHLKTEKFRCKFETILSYLYLSSWDPHLFNLYFETLLEKLPSASPIEKKSLLEGLHKIAKNFYFIPDRENSIKKIADIYFELKHYHHAIYYYCQSVLYYGTTPSILHKIAQCFFYSNAFEKARLLFEKVKKLEPCFPNISEWIQKTKIPNKNKSFLYIRSAIPEDLKEILEIAKNSFPEPENWALAPSNLTQYQPDYDNNTPHGKIEIIVAENRYKNIAAYLYYQHRENGDLYLMELASDPQDNDNKVPGAGAMLLKTIIDDAVTHSKAQRSTLNIVRKHKNSNQLIDYYSQFGYRICEENGYTAHGTPRNTNNIWMVAKDLGKTRLKIQKHLKKKHNCCTFKALD